MYLLVGFIKVLEKKQGTIFISSLGFFQIDELSRRFEGFNSIFVGLSTDLVGSGSYLNGRLSILLEGMGKIYQKDK